MLWHQPVDSKKIINDEAERKPKICQELVCVRGVVGERQSVVVFWVVSA